MAKASRHQHVTISHGALQAEVDEGIADVILETWRAGIATQACCQGYYERSRRCSEAYILFSALDAEKWMKIVAPDAPSFDEPQTARLKRHHERLGYGTNARRWKFWLTRNGPYNLGVEFRVGIHFPAAELDELRDILRSHNKRRPRAATSRAAQRREG